MTTRFLNYMKGPNSLCTDQYTLVIWKSTNVLQYTNKLKKKNDIINKCRKKHLTKSNIYDTKKTSQ